MPMRLPASRAPGVSREGYRRCQDLRKTARGASSPAKPALHMPELMVCQFPFIILALVPAGTGQHRGRRLEPSAVVAGLRCCSAQRVGEGKCSVGSLPIVDNESGDFLCTAEKPVSKPSSREEEVIGRARAEKPSGTARAASGGRWPMGWSGSWEWERDRNLPSILIRRFWVQRGRFQTTNNKSEMGIERNANPGSSRREER